MSQKNIKSIVNLKKKAKCQEAIAILERIAAHVQPIMKNRGWRVGTLAEFYPTQANLLGTNLNKGQKISLRLRQSYNDTDFLPFSDVIGTMLHELAHIQCGPHDAKFYALLDDLNIEYDSLLSSGFKGNDGDFLGGHKITIAGARKAAAQQALKRSRGTPAGGVVLGGSKEIRHEKLKKLVAGAADRRAFDSKWCGYGRPDDPVVLDDEDLEFTTTRDVPRENSTRIDVKERELEALEGVMHPEIIEIASDDEAEQGKKRATVKKRPVEQDQSRSDYRRMKQRGLLPDSLEDHLQKLKAARTRSVPPEVLAPTDSLCWQCPLCTLKNPLINKHCEACTHERPSSVGKSRDKWVCIGCHSLNDSSMWMCSVCQSIKQVS